MATPNLSGPRPHSMGSTDLAECATRQLLIPGELVIEDAPSLAHLQQLLLFCRRNKTHKTGTSTCGRIKMGTSTRLGGLQERAQKQSLSSVSGRSDCYASDMVVSLTVQCRRTQEWRSSQDSHYVCWPRHASPMRREIGRRDCGSQLNIPVPSMRVDTPPCSATPAVCYRARSRPAVSRDALGVSGTTTQ